MLDGFPIENATPENRLIQLRHQFEQTTDTKARRLLVRDIAQTGTFVAMMTLAQQLDDAALQKDAARGIAAIALSHPEFDGHNTRQLLARAIPVYYRDIYIKRLP